MLRIILTWSSNTTYLAVLQRSSSSKVECLRFLFFMYVFVFVRRSVVVVVVILVIVSSSNDSIVVDA